ALVRERRPELNLEPYGEGPERGKLEQLVAELELQHHVRILGQRSEEEITNAFARAACVATASEREGYGLVVVEAAAHGTPSVVVAGHENAALELVVDGVNGTVAPSSIAPAIAEAIDPVVEAGDALRTSTRRWFDENRSNLLVDSSVEQVLDAYARADDDGPRSSTTRRELR